VWRDELLLATWWAIISHCRIPLPSLRIVEPFVERHSYCVYLIDLIATIMSADETTAAPPAAADDVNDDDDDRTRRQWYHEIAPFNGGKMNHIWTPGKGYYESTFANAAAERCFHNPHTIISLKVHGECALLLKTPIVVVVDVPEEDDVVLNNSEEEEDAKMKNVSPAVPALYEWTFATRYDTRGKKDPPAGAIPLPGVHQLPELVDQQNGVINHNNSSSPQPAVYQDHHYWLIPLEKNLVTGKGQRQTYVGRDTYGAIAAGVATGDIPDPNQPNDTPSFISVEWIGRKHQGNIDGIDADHAICLHGSTRLNHLLPIPRSRAQVEYLAATESIEGLVLYDPDTTERFKIRFDMVVPNAKFTQQCNQSPVTMTTTSIKPKAIVAAAVEVVDDVVGSSTSS
jgi:hypothetical protein